MITRFGNIKLSFEFPFFDIFLIPIIILFLKFSRIHNIKKINKKINFNKPLIILISLAKSKPQRYQ